MRLPSLYNFFRHQVSHGFQAHGLGDASTIDYVSELLTRFAQARAFYALADADGRPLSHIVDMLGAMQSSPDRAAERVVVRHIGEYTLFMSGIFRERLTRRGELDYYMAHGRSAYWHTADYEINPQRRRVFRRLYEEFAPISDMLDYLRRVQLPLATEPTRANLLAAAWRV